MNSGNIIEASYSYSYHSSVSNGAEHDDPSPTAIPFSYRIYIPFVRSMD